LLKKPLRIYAPVGAPIYKTRRDFWTYYQRLPTEIQQLADEKFELLKRNPAHSSLNFKKVGRYWSVRISQQYRALVLEDAGIFVWTWIGKHDEYMKRVQ
jgi:hypothetical protein